LTRFLTLLQHNRNYRYTWLGQVVSEIGDHFNTIAVFSLALHHANSGLVLSGVMLARALPAIVAGPLAGVTLDRLDRKRVMIASDLIRAVVAAVFIVTVQDNRPVLLALLSALLMAASPFFTSGRSSVLPTIASREELHTANALTQITQWGTLILGAVAGGVAVGKLGFAWAFLVNSASFLFSAWCISRLSVESGGFRAQRRSLTEADVVRPWHEYKEGLRYMRGEPLVLGIALLGIGWATGGGAAQILFGLFGEVVFQRGALGIGTIWASAGIGLLLGGLLAHAVGPRLSFRGYKRTVTACYLVHGAAYVGFSQMRSFAWALVFIALSRFAIAISSVINFSRLLRQVPDAYRGRVFATHETLVWATMMLSMGAAGVASLTISPRTIGLWSGVLSASTAFVWGWADASGRLPEPSPMAEDEDLELHGEPIVSS
jgi:MFS family permease